MHIKQLEFIITSYPKKIKIKKKLDSRKLENAGFSLTVMVPTDEGHVVKKKEERNKKKKQNEANFQESKHGCRRKRPQIHLEGTWYLEFEVAVD